MSRKDYLAASRILRETTMPTEVRSSLVARFVTMFADDNARFSPSRFREACEPTTSYVVTLRNKAGEREATHSVNAPDADSAAQVAIEREMVHRQRYGLACPSFTWQLEQVA